MPGLRSSCPLYVWNISSLLQAFSYPVVLPPALWTNAPRCQATARGQKSNVPQIPTAPGKILLPLGITAVKESKGFFKQMLAHCPPVKNWRALCGAHQKVKHQHLIRKKHLVTSAFLLLSHSCRGTSPLWTSLPPDVPAG